MANVSEETKTLITMLRHRAIVASYLRQLSAQLAARADMHDVSKLSIEQFARFVEINRIGREHKYGSDAYIMSMKNHAGTLAQHFMDNSHHPEHYEAGVDGMGLADIIEMVLDWQTAAVVYGNTTLEEGIAIQIDRFGLDERHLYLIDLIRRELDAES